MAKILVGSDLGCRVFTETGEEKVELAERKIFALAPDVDGTCLAIVDWHEIWRRNNAGDWSLVTTTGVHLSSILSVKGTIFAGTADAALIRILPNGEAERIVGFDQIEGREEWLPVGPPVHVRALTGTANGETILAAVHVGGIPRSTDGGKTWAPTIPIMHDVHQVKFHPTKPNFAAAAAAVGLLTSDDGGKNWTIHSAGLPQPSYCLALDWLQDEVLFSHEDGPFAKKSQIWRWPIKGGSLQQVRDGLPEWLEGKVDTGRISSNGKQVALVDYGGNLWLSGAGAKNWQCIASKLNGRWAGGQLLL